MKRIAWYATVVMFTLTGLMLLWELRSVLILILLSMATASAFRPLIARFELYRLPRSAALGLAYLLVLGILAGLLTVIYRPLIANLQEASNQLTMRYDAILATWPMGTLTQQAIAEQLPTTQELTQRLTGEEGAKSIQNLVGLTNNIFWFIGQVGLILILSIYWSADNLRIERLWLALLPIEARAQARETYRAIESGVGAYIRSEVIQSLLAGIMLWTGYQVLGMKYAVLMALLGALAWLIPWFGALLAILPPALAGYALGGAPLAGLAVAYTLLVLFVQEWVIEPRFFLRETYNSIILVMLILVLSQEFGLLGLILAPLVSAAVQITLRYLAQPPVTANLARVEVTEIGEQIEALQKRVDVLKTTLQEQEETPPEMRNLMERLKKLIGEAQAYIGENLEKIEAQKPKDTREKLPLPGSVKPRG